MDGVVTIDERGTILSFNPAAERIFGFTGVEAIGRNIGILLPSPERDQSVGHLEHYLRIGDPKGIDVGREVRGERKDGTAVPLDLHVSEFNDGAGRQFVFTIRDVSERKRTEEQLRKQQSELAHVLRLATIEHLAATLAHELNQPLTAIANDVEACASYVRSRSGDRAKLLTLLDRAGAEALRAGEIVHHLREFVQRTERQLSSTDLSGVVRNAIRWLVQAMEHERIVLDLDLASEELPIRVDRVQIEQVLVNLLQNAIDAICEPGSPAREIRVRTSRSEDGLVEVAIDDTGTGLRPAAVEQLYEPFFTTKSHGMGMGLAISRSIVEMHGGRLSVGPRASGGGTTVRMALPLDLVSGGKARST
jgi:two-component system sensor kinase FixL